MIARVAMLLIKVMFTNNKRNIVKKRQVQFNEPSNGMTLISKLKP